MNRDILKELAGAIISLTDSLKTCDFERVLQDISLINSLIEPSLNARYPGAEADRIARSVHRIKTSIASIRTAIEMLMAGGLLEEDEAQLKSLAYQGIKELTDIIEK